MMSGLPAILFSCSEQVNKITPNQGISCQHSSRDIVSAHPLQLQFGQLCDKLIWIHSPLMYCLYCSFHRSFIKYPYIHTTTQAWGHLSYYGVTNTAATECPHSSRVPEVFHVDLRLRVGTTACGQVENFLCVDHCTFAQHPCQKP